MKGITVLKRDEVFSEIFASPDILDRIEDAFSFSIPKFRPASKGGTWYQTARLFFANNRLLYNGLVSQLEDFAKERKLHFNKISDAIEHQPTIDISVFLSSLKLPFAPHDYQIDAIKTCIASKRQLVLSPTSSGKSLQIYLLAKWFDCPTLIIVPRATLATQFMNEFIEYGESPDNIQLIGGGRPLDVTKKIVIALWQSVWRLPEKWYDQFGLMVGDEVHTFHAKSLVTMMEKTGAIPLKFGFTGTLAEDKFAETRLIGLFGPITKTITTMELMERGIISKFRIKVVLLSYSETDIEPAKAAKMEYGDEIAFLSASQRRNAFIANLAASLPQNTIVLFSNIETHGDILLQEIQRRVKGRPVFYIHGGVSPEKRDEIKRQIQDATSSILLASKATFATGENIKALHNCIFASPSKGKIINLQAIGRGLRLHNTKNEFIVFDIADDLRYKKKLNPTYKQYEKRLALYAKEGFAYTVIKHRLK